jgi:fucose 4-O-acetylase-like acetyltransferase
VTRQGRRRAGRRPTAQELTAATPATRNRYIDLLRVLSILVVVVGHWLMAVLGWVDGRFTGKNLLEIDPGIRIITWIFQVVPVFFIVGGFTNAASWTSARRRDESYAEWLRSRCGRLLRPAIVFVAFWTILPVVAVLAGLLPSGVARTGGKEVALPLWFLAAYLLAVAVVPPLLAMHHRFGIRFLAAAIAATVVVDVARYGFGLRYLGVANYVFVWLAVLQLGFLWRDGKLTNRGWMPWTMMGAGVVVLVGLVAVADYPVSMVGLTHAVRSNTFPPSLALLALSVAQTGTVLLFQRAGNRWLLRPRVWLSVAVANGMVMTFYLWNMTAAVLAAVLVLPTGIAPQPEPLSAAWWWLRPAWIAVCAICLVPFLLAFRWAERPGRLPSPTDDGPIGVIAALCGVVAAAGGLAVVAAVAFPVPGEDVLVPSLGVVSLAVGSLLLGIDPAAALRRAREELASS